MTRLKRILLIAALPVAAILLAASILLLHPYRASASSLVPFKAIANETYTAGKCGPTSVCINAVGTGQGTQLGELTEYASVVVDINPADQHNGCAPETRATVLVAANGDTLTMSATGYTRCPGSNVATDSYIVTGGTGRFQGASGSGTDSNTHNPTGPSGGTAVTTFSGNLSSVGSN